MLFNSYAFIFLFLPLVLCAAARLKGGALLRWITVSSFVFYGFAGHAWFLIPMLITTILDFYLAPRIASAHSTARRKAVLIASLTCNLGLLCYFKYSALLLHTSLAAATFLLHADASPRWLLIFHATLPAGISFYTFQTMSYVIDVYRGHAEPERGSARAGSQAPARSFSRGPYGLPVLKRRSLGARPPAAALERGGQLSRGIDDDRLQADLDRAGNGPGQRTAPAFKRM